MKIDCFVTAADEPLSGAVAEAAALFGISCGGVLAAEALGDSLPSGAVYVLNRVMETADGTEVISEVYFRRETGGLGNIVKRSDRAEADEANRAAAKRLVRLNLLRIFRQLTGENPVPWGILRGVRPTKIVHRMLDKGLAGNVVSKKVQDLYGVARDKAELVTAIACRQRPLLLSTDDVYKLVSVYVGIPYCPSRCLYCSFPAYTLPGERKQVEGFLTALYRDMAAAAADIARHGFKVQTVYIGGGTPTSLDDTDFAAMLEYTRRLFVSEATREFTVEAGRPDSITPAKIAAMVSHGVDRVSVNPQSMQEKTLKLIGRKHSVQDIIDMLGKIRESGIPVINMDIIAGLPGETELDMADTMTRLAALAPDNLTVHTLALKRGAELKTGKAEYNMPDEQVTAHMVGIAADYARKMGMVPYYLYRQKYMTGNLENVGYAKPGTECLYNVQIMEERQTIIGIGPNAGTKAVRRDWRLDSVYNPKDINTYITNVDGYAARRSNLLAKLFES